MLGPAQEASVQLPDPGRLSSFTGIPVGVRWHAPLSVNPFLGICRNFGKLWCNCRLFLLRPELRRTQSRISLASPYRESGIHTCGKFQ